MSDLFPDELTPGWLDGELWGDFIQHRKEIKKPLTETATKRMLRKLERWHAAGVNVNECLERSIINRWQDIYEPDKKPAASSASSYIEDLFAQGYRLDLSKAKKRPE